MDNNTDHIISNENDVPTVVFTEWPLDEDDAEFRAGYPFIPIPLEEVNEREAWCDLSSTSDGHSFQSVNSQNNDHFNETTNDDKTSDFSFGEHEELMEVDMKSSTIQDNSDDYDVDAHQKQDDEEHERNQYDQNNIVQIDNVNDKKTNQAHSTK